MHAEFDVHIPPFNKDDVPCSGNILIIAVLRRMRSDTSTLPLFFTALAASDLCLLYVGLVPPWIEYQFGYSIHASHTVG